MILLHWVDPPSGTRSLYGSGRALWRVFSLPIELQILRLIILEIAQESVIRRLLDEPLDFRTGQSFRAADQLGDGVILGNGQAFEQILKQDFSSIVIGRPDKNPCIEAPRS